MIACKETFHLLFPPPPPPPQKKKKKQKNKDDWNPNPQIFFRHPLRTEIHFFVGTFKIFVRWV